MNIGGSKGGTMEKRSSKDRRYTSERRKIEDRRHLILPIIPDKRIGNARRLSVDRRRQARRREDVVVI